jgi:LacI family transcriptional regulator
MAKRPTVADVARSAGLSVATVDRVLNARLPVRDETARRVYEAAEATGYHAAGLIKQRIREGLPEYRLGFQLLRPDTYFYRQFASEITEAVERSPRMRGTAIVEFSPSLVPSEIVSGLQGLGERSRAVALVAPDHPTLTTAVAELKEKGVPVFSLLSDFAGSVREGYVGLDNRKVGRTAAWMIAKAARKPGKVAIFVGSHRFDGHELREMGFRSYFREHAPDFTILETQVNLEAAQITHEAIASLLARHPDLAGCYVAGGGIEGAIAGLREAGTDGGLIAVCNELTPETRAALADQIATMVISTPLTNLCRELVDLMVNAIEARSAGVPGQTFLPFDIYVPENI